MQLWTRMAVGGLLAASVAATAFVIARNASGTRSAPRSHEPARLMHRSFDTPVPPIVVPSQSAPTPVDEPPQVTASAAHCDLSWIPKGYVHPIGEAATRALAADLDDWISHGTGGVVIEYRRGVAYV